MYGEIQEALAFRRQQTRAVRIGTGYFAHVADWQ